jgi:hypothetical protein
LTSIQTGATLRKIMPSASNDVDFARWRDIAFLIGSAWRVHRPTLHCRAALGGLVKMMLAHKVPRTPMHHRFSRCGRLHHARLVFGWRRAEIGSDLLLTSMLRMA